MRKFYTLLLTATMAATLSASAAVSNNNEWSNLKRMSQSDRLQLQGLHNSARQQAPALGTQAINVQTPFSQLKQRVKSNKARLISKAEAEAPEYITEAPAGETKLFYRNSYGYTYSWFGLYADQDYGAVGEVVFADNNEVYFKNPYSSFPTDTYLKGTIDGDVITVKFPQAVYAYDYYGTIYDYYAAKLVYTYVEGEDEDDSYYTFAVTDDQEMQFKYDGEQIYQLGENQDDVLLGMVSYDENDEGEEELYWAGYGDTEIEFLPFEDELVTVPETATVTEKALIYDDGGGAIINVAKDGNDIYFQGLNSDYAEAWVKGTLADGKVTIPSNQYIGISDYLNHFIFFFGGTATLNYYDYLDYYYTTYNISDALELNYDAATDSYTAGEENNVAIANIGHDVTYVDTANGIIEIRTQGDISESTPADPVITDYSAYRDDWGYGYLEFTFTATDTEGNVLPTGKLFYNVLVDGEIYTLYPDEYFGLSDELTDIPYGFIDDYYDLYSNGATHYFYFYFEGAETIGVQTIYRPSEGKEFRSNVVAIDATSVKTIVNDNKQISSETYYDLTGRTVVNPEHGLFIKKINYSDGTAKAEKVIK